MRTLTLTSPPMTGDDVAAVRKALGFPPRGAYDEATAAAVEAWKWRVGYPEERVDGVLAARGQAWLLGTKPLPPEHEVRAAQRARDAELGAHIDRFINKGRWRIRGDARYAERSPLEGFGETFVRAGRKHGVDPLFLVAIATHENRLGTFKAIQPKHNTFGLGPGRSYPSWEANIEAAARNLSRPGGFYVGKNTIRSIGLTWAPIGAGNDPADLNQHWVGSVARFYGQLGGRDDHDALVKTRP
jgi:Mannosyl-glycoprotein endo-beta-N-acetylglucosaminidase